MWDTHVWTENLQEQKINLASKTAKAELDAFLHSQGLRPDRNIEYSMVITDNGRIAATGSFSGNVLKCIAVDEDYKGSGLSAKVITHLVSEQFRRGRNRLFIFTKPENAAVFKELGFHTLAEAAGSVVLMENRPDGINRYLDELAAETGETVPSASVVVNCNPFTNGHKYLLEYAAANCGLLHVFVVEEDKSVFPFEVRYRLIREGISHLNNVILHKGGDYIISNATFPSYFLKEYDDPAEIQARLDLEIFTRYIAKRLNIIKRFVGEEPCCALTAAYNRIMKKELSLKGIEVEEVLRLESEGLPISASRVRELIRKGEMETVMTLVPDTTYRFLETPEAEDIIRKISEERPINSLEGVVIS